MRNNPLLKTYLNTDGLVRLGASAFLTMLLWIGCALTLRAQQGEDIRGAFWLTVNLLTIVVWFVPVIVFGTAVQRIQRERQTEAFRLLQTTALSPRAMLIGYVGNMLVRLRYIPLLSPLILIMASLYHDRLGAEIMPPLNLLPMLFMWSAALLAAVVVGVWVGLQVSQRMALWLSLAPSAGLIFAAAGLIRESMKVECPPRIEVEPLPWLAVTLTFLLVAALVFSLANTSRKPSLLLVGCLSLALFTSSTAVGWVGQVQMRVERYAMATFLDLLPSPVVSTPPDPCGLNGVNCACGRIKNFAFFPLMTQGVLSPEIAEFDYLRNFEASGFPIEEIPPEIGSLKRLESVIFSQTELSELPSEIGQLRLLNRLNVPRNNLTDLPETITDLHNLTMLDVSDNNLTELPADIDRLSELRILLATGNDIEQIPVTVAELESLRIFQMSSNQLEEVPPEIAGMTSLEVLTLRGNQLTNLPPDLYQLPNLHTLDIAYNPWDVVTEGECVADYIAMDEDTCYAFCTEVRTCQR